MTSRPWRDAWQRALYGVDGFYQRELPSDHFRTASHAAAPALAAALVEFARRHGLTRVVDVGCGAGELLAALAAADAVSTVEHPAGHPGGTRARQPANHALELIGVELRSRPETVPSRIEWFDRLPHLDATPTLLIGWELLDVVPATVAVADDNGDWSTVDVDERGNESPGAPLGPADRQWCLRWAPEPAPGARIEVGRSREEFWLELVGRLPNGVALAVDYGVEVASQSLTGFRGGRVVRPVPDGSCDLTAHVHWPGLAGAVASLGPTTLTPQAAALTRLGVRAAKPPAGLAWTDGVGYLQALQRFSTEQELLDPSGLGGFGWLCTRVG